ncbi:MAG: NMD3-related protein [Candidatus Aenigmatarchaeota archaeon]
MLCAICGKESVKDIALCDKHFLEKNELFTIKNFHLEVCHCGAFYTNKWEKSSDINESIRKAIEKNIKTENKIKNIDISLKIVGNRAYADINAVGFIDPSKVEKSEKKKIYVIMKRHMCDDCVKMSGGYYDAMIQVRGKTDDIMKKITLPEGSVLNLNKDGADIKFIKKADATRIAGLLRKWYDVKSSCKLVTQKKGKKLYRNFYSVR